ncbi:MAG: beta-ketoacyl synthase chain length factor [Cytophaga sp.]|uniref:beta-ketoacyl synthase chain length factor n=1 Tax=Cytophaga sp. TaxID=29535 RepID=UPI003F80EC5C
MQLRNIYINGLSAVSAQPTVDETFLQGDVAAPSAAYRKAIEPEYKQYLNPTASRRFSKLIKMSLVAAQKSIAMAEGVMPEAIITGTGLGCLEDTEKFLRSLIENNESMLSPTAFIQSTHNTISGQIAMMITCYHPNYTYSNRYFSFESSLLDGVLMLQDNSCKNILVNAADEVIPVTNTVLKRLGLWDRGEAIAGIDSVPVQMGEGVVSMVLSTERTVSSMAVIRALELIYILPENKKIEDIFTEFLQAASLKVSDVDVVILGMNGDIESDAHYEPVRTLFQSSTQLVYKHLFGESFTASAHAYWLAVQVLHKKQVPASCILTDEGHKEPKRIIIYNQFRGKYHSFCLLTDVEV